MFGNIIPFTNVGLPTLTDGSSGYCFHLFQDYKQKEEK